MTFLSPEALKRLDHDHARRYCDEIRSVLVRQVTQNGGHLASNLGITEISVALLRVFDPEKDRILYDTGHQSYVHKILTGRGEAFSSLRCLDGLSGFPNRAESTSDPFGTGHSGTGISAALAFAKAGRIRGENLWSVAVIGDGAFTGGMVFEALNNVSPTDRLIIILNDNGMSISKSVGTLKGAFARMRTRGYYRFKGEVRQALSHLNAVGEVLANTAKRVKDSIKHSAIPQGNLFEQFGLSYFGPADGNDLETVEFLLRQAKEKNGPSVIHLCTKKGKGHPPAEKNPSAFHGLSPKNETKPQGLSYSKAFGKCLLEIANKDPQVVAITAAMCDGVGLTEFQKTHPNRYFDIGIAEEHAMTFAAGLCAAGLKPCFAVYSTFFQRAFDQFLHDAALQKLPAVVCLDRAGISGEDGATHHGLFDLAMTLPIPGVKIFAPVTEKEMKEQLKDALSRQDGPTVIRYPKDGIDPLIGEFFSGEGQVEEALFGQGEHPDLTFVSFGRQIRQCILAALALSQKGLRVKVVRFGVLKGFSPDALPSYFGDAKAILFAEEGIRQGGFSQFLSDQLFSLGLLPQKTKILAVEDCFVPHGKASALIQRVGLDAQNLEKEGFLLATT